MGLTFLPRPPPRPRKRSRAAADIDGEHSCMQKKKRRLRLFLITSRLSPQFSHPATNIVDRGSSKIAVWAKQKSLGRNLLRKAAILNRIRRRAVSAKEAKDGHGHVLVEQEREQEELALAKLEFNHGSVDTYTRPVTLQTPSVPPAAAIRTGGRFLVSGSPTGSPTGSPNPSRSPSPTPPSPPSKRANKSPSDYCSPNDAYLYSPPRAQIPRRDYLPLPPSPLGLSNYDAFDVDEDMPDPYSYLNDEEDEPSTHLFDEDDEEETDVVPFSPSAVTSPSSPSLKTAANQVLDAPPQPLYSDFSILDHSEPVFGDYDGVDEGADAVWPSSYAKEASAATAKSTSPDFHALFATSTAKRADSFATSPNFRPSLPASTTPVSPNFLPLVPATTSPNFAPSPISPTGPSRPMQVSVSPNFAAIDATSNDSYPILHRRMSVPTPQRSDDRTRRNSDIEQERRRQRDLMFTRFGS